MLIEPDFVNVIDIDCLECHFTQMADLIRTLTERYVDAANIAARARREMCKALRRKSDLLLSDEQTRRTELKKDQQDFYLAVLRHCLLNDAAPGMPSSAELERAAEEILSKPGYKAGRDPKREGRRTKREEQHYGNARVQWSVLLKEAGVPAIDPRGG